MDLQEQRERERVSASEQKGSKKSKGDFTEGLDQGASTASRAGGIDHNGTRSSRRVLCGTAVLVIIGGSMSKVHSIGELVCESSLRNRLKGIEPSYWDNEEKGKKGEGGSEINKAWDD